MIVVRNDILIHLRESLGETQEQVAKSIGISRSMYAMIELGERGGRYPTLKKIADHFGKTVDEIFSTHFFGQDAHRLGRDASDANENSA
ncbi:MAG: helix-turn-helix transcriptional regulator [Firmicutes bacterium]|nr:helix-turn-helix transcriptional regulator [Bacillota bacterium]